MIKGLIIGIFFLLIFGGLLAGGYFYLDSKGYFNTVLEEPKIEKVSFYIEPLNLFTDEPITLNYRLIESQVVTECLKDQVLKNYKKTQKSVQEHNDGLLEQLEDGEINNTQYEEAKKSFEVNKSYEFYVIYPNLQGKNINAAYCYISGLKDVNSGEGIIAPGLNEFLLKKETIYTFYYWREGEYYLNKDILLGVSTPPEVYRSENLSLSDAEEQISPKSIEKIYANPMVRNVSIDIWGEIESNQTQAIRINLKGDNELRHVDLCFEWTFGVVDVKSDYPELSLPFRLNNIANKCFRTSTSLIQSNSFMRSYDVKVETSQLIPNDFLKIYVIDEERYDQAGEYKFSVEGSNGQNIGAADFTKINYLKEGISG